MLKRCARIAGGTAIPLCLSAQARAEERNGMMDARMQPDMKTLIEQQQA